MIRIILFFLCFNLTYSFAFADPYLSTSKGVVLRTLDYITGETRDYSKETGEIIRLGKLEVSVGECRYSTDETNLDSFAYLRVVDQMDNIIFSGWMIASSASLSAMDHPRYDIWVLRCQ